MRLQRETLPNTARPLQTEATNPLDVSTAALHAQAALQFSPANTDADVHAITRLSWTTVLQQAAASCTTQPRNARPRVRTVL